MKFTSVQFPVGQNFILKYISWDFPGGSVVKTLPSREFPGGPVAKTLHSQCRAARFDVWLGN